MKKYIIFSIAIGSSFLTLGQTNEYSLKNQEASAYSALKVLAERGDPVSESKLGDHFAKGLVVSIDLAKSFYWHLKAANHGVPYSQYVVGDYYSNGVGVKRDDVEAFRWTLKAAKSGECSAISNVSLMYSNGIGVLIEAERAYYWKLKLNKNCSYDYLEHEIFELEKKFKINPERIAHIKQTANENRDIDD
jgi:TPR repeat protein